MTGVSLSKTSVVCSMSRKAIIIDLTVSDGDLPSKPATLSTPSPTLRLPDEKDPVVDLEEPVLIEGSKRTKSPVPAKRPPPIEDREEDDVVLVKTIKSPVSAVKPAIILVSNLSAIGNSFSAAPKPGVENKKCPICLDPLSRPAATICGHVFCTPCIAAAVNAHQLCPICRKKLSKKNGYHALFL